MLQRENTDIQIHSIKNYRSCEKITRSGIWPDVDIDTYHSSDGISNSGIGLILKSPKSYWYEYMSGMCVREDSPAKMLGRAVHVLALEQEIFESRYLVIPKIDRRTKAGKEEYENIISISKNREIISDELFSQAKAMADSIRESRMFKKLYLRDGKIEHSIAWNENESGALLRARPDYFNDLCIVDIKTSSDASRDEFSRSIARYGYHRQAAMNIDGLNELTGIKHENFVTFVVENQEPYLTASYLISEAAIDEGRRQYKKGARIYAESVKTGKWEGYGDSVIEIDMPAWGYQQGINL